MLGSNPGLLRLWHWKSDALTNDTDQSSLRRDGIGESNSPVTETPPSQSARASEGSHGVVFAMYCSTSGEVDLKGFGRTIRGQNA